MTYSNSSISISAGGKVAIALRALCFFVGVPGNIAVVVFLVRHFKRNKFTTQLMLSLAIADILCLIILPVWTYEILLSWTLGLTLCKITCFVTYTSIHASVLTITLMSVHRYVVVCHHHQWSRLGKWGERGLVMIVWVLAGLIAIPPAITYSVTWFEDQLHCQQIVESENEKLVLLLLEIVLIYMLPLIILTTSYVCLHRHVRDRARANTRHRLGPLVTWIVVTFVIFSTPYVIVNAMTIAKPLVPASSGKRFAYRYIRGIVQGIIYLNSCVDPLLYAFNIRSLRENAQGRLSVTATHTQTQPQQHQVSTVEGGPGQEPQT